MPKRKLDIEELRSKVQKMQEEMAALTPLLCDEEESSETDSDESTSSSVLAFRALTNKGDEDKENSEGNQQSLIPSPKKPPVDPEILDILGIDSNTDLAEMATVDGDLIRIWRNLVNKGLSKDEKGNLMNKYKGIPELQAKRLNAEISASLPPKMQRKDAYMAEMQDLGGSSLMALGSVITQFMSDQECDKLLLLKSLSDVAKMNIAIHHSISVSRKANIFIPDLTPQVAEIIKKAEMDDTLYGNKLGERIKESKALAKLSLDIKQKPPATVEKKPFLFKSPQQRKPFSAHTGSYQGRPQSRSTPSYKTKQQFFSSKTRNPRSNSSSQQRK